MLTFPVTFPYLNSCFALKDIRSKPGHPLWKANCGYVVSQAKGFVHKRVSDPTIRLGSSAAQVVEGLIMRSYTGYKSLVVRWYSVFLPDKDPGLELQLRWPCARKTAKFCTLSFVFPTVCRKRLRLQVLFCSKSKHLNLYWQTSRTY